MQLQVKDKYTYMYMYLQVAIGLIAVKSLSSSWHVAENRVPDDSWEFSNLFQLYAGYGYG